MGGGAGGDIGRYGARNLGRLRQHLAQHRHLVRVRVLGLGLGLGLRLGLGFASRAAWEIYAEIQGDAGRCTGDIRSMATSSPRASPGSIGVKSTWLGLGLGLGSGIGSGLGLGLGLRLGLG